MNLGHTQVARDAFAVAIQLIKVVISASVI